jgi:rhodanese-related sulfurtransferase
VIEFRLSPAQARSRLDGGEALPLDVTSSLVYPAVTRRIPGAIRIPPEPILRGLERAAPPSDILGHFGGLPDDRELIAYCT